MKLEPLFLVSIDRTERRLGTKWINVLMLSVVWEGVAIPVVWAVFRKKGCSSDSEPRAMVEKYLRIFGAETIAFVTADREFASAKWLEYLSSRQINFVLRIKSSAFITDRRGNPMQTSKLLQSTDDSEKLICRCKMCGGGSIAGGRQKS